MEDREIDDEGVAFARNHIVCDDLVSPGVRQLAKVNVGRQDIGLDLVVCDFARVQLHDEIFFECLHGVVLL